MAREAEQLLVHALAGDRGAVEVTARDVLQRHGVQFLYESVVQPALERVGELWRANRITVADEHLATATVQAAIAGLYGEYPWPRRGERKVLVACVEGERHDLGARMFADLAALEGWDDVYLGADVPLDALVAKVVEARPAVVALSLTIAFHLPALRAAIARMRTVASAPGIVVGGRAALEVPDLADLTGADAVARSASQGVEAIRAWR
ncbi:MAG: cobalamin-dependent protein [Thermodesulfobacteriota bacterium]